MLRAVDAVASKLEEDWKQENHWNTMGNGSAL